MKKDMTIEERIAFYVGKLQEAVQESGYNVASKETLLSVVRQYVEAYKPPQHPSEAKSIRPTLPEVDFKNYTKPIVPTVQPPTNVVDIFSKKK